MTIGGNGENIESSLATTCLNRCDHHQYVFNRYDRHQYFQVFPINLGELGITVTQHTVLNREVTLYVFTLEKPSVEIYKIFDGW